MKFEEVFDAVRKVSFGIATGGNSNGVSSRFLSSVFFVFLSFEVIGKTRKVDSRFSVAARWTRVRWKEEMPLPESLSGDGIVADMARIEGSISTSDCSMHEPVCE